MPGALTRYGSRGGLIRYGSYGNPYLRAGATLYANRRRIRMGLRAVRGAKRAFTSYRARSRKRAKFSPKRMGSPPNTNSPKTNTVHQLLTQFDTRTLGLIDLTTIQRGDGINERERDTLHLSGVKFCWELRNDTELPLYLNMAVVHIKGCTPIEDIAKDFFRGAGNNTSNGRFLDFSDELTSNEFRCLPLNTDKFVVLHHKRMRLIPQDQSAERINDQSGRNYRNVDWYTKINRTIQYDENGARTDNSNLYFMYWCDQYLQPGGTLPVTGALQTQRKFITYFHEPRR